MDDLRERLQFVGVHGSIIEKMIPLEATVLGENNTLYRVCEHGIKHPVGHVDRPVRVATDYSLGTFVDKHRSGSPLESTVKCDGCCADWPKK